MFVMSSYEFYDCFCDSKFFPVISFLCKALARFQNASDARAAAMALKLLTFLKHSLDSSESFSDSLTL